MLLLPPGRCFVPATKAVIISELSPGGSRRRRELAGEFFGKNRSGRQQFLTFGGNRQPLERSSHRLDSSGPDAYTRLSAVLPPREVIQRWV